MGTYDFSKVYVSPLARARQTLEAADAAANGKMSEVKVMDDLREIDLYEWQGMLKEDIKEQYPEAFSRWRREIGGASQFKLPSGNAPIVQLWERARGVWEHVLADAEACGRSELPTLLVAHNGIIQALLCIAMGLGEDFFRKFEVPNCGVIEVEWVPGEASARRWRWLYPEEDAEWQEIGCLVSEEDSAEVPESASSFS